MRPFAACFHVFFLGLFMLAVVPQPALAQQESITSATPDIVQDLRESAGGDREQARRAQSQAEAYREQAARAQRAARVISDPVSRQGYLDEVERTQGHAERLEADAARLLERAEEREARAARLEAAWEQKLAEERARAERESRPPEPRPALAGDTRADMLREQAAEAREEGSLQERLSIAWLELSGQARGELAHTSHPAVEAAIRDAISLYEHQSRVLAADARTSRDEAWLFEQAAAKTEEEDAGLLPGELPPPPVSAFTGRWVEEDNDSVEIRIEEANPDSQDNLLRLISRRHVWNGEYTPASQPEPARLSFSKQPAAQSMSPEVPEWARRQMEGRLEWRLEADTEDVCSIDTLQARWFPGEVSWEQEAGRAWVSGDGEPVTIRYVRAPPDLADGLAFPSISFVAAQAVEGEYPPIDETARGLPFRVKLVLPQEHGDRTGATATVTLHGGRGTSTTVELTGHRTQGGPWVYLSDLIFFETQSSLFDYLVIAYISYFEMIVRAKHGSLRVQDPEGALDLTIANGGIVTAEFDSARAEIAVFSGPAAFAIHRVRADLDDIEIVLRTEIFLGEAADPSLNERSLAQIRNARTYLNYSPGATESWPELMPLAIGAQYLWLLNDVDGARQGADVSDMPPNRHGVVYRTGLEDVTIESTMAKVRETTPNAARALIEQALSHVDTDRAFLHFLPLPLDDILITFTGEDWYGNKADRFDQRLATARLALGAVAGLANQTGAMMARRAALRREMALRLSPEEARMLASLEAQAAANWRRGAGRPIETPLPPSTVPPTERTAAQVRRNYADLVGDAWFTIRETPATIRHGVSQCSVPSGCVPASIGFMLDVKNVARVSMSYLARFMEHSLAIRIAGRGVGAGEKRLVLQKYGAKTRFIRYSVEEMAEGVKQGKLYSVSINYAAAPRGHSVVVTDVRRVGNSHLIDYFDVNARGIVTMTKTSFDRMKCAVDRYMLEVDFSRAR